jgi:uncharacterized membrane protein
MIRKIEYARKRERVMKKILTILSIMVVISICPLGHAFDGRPPRGSLEQLPANKEMLFHQTMRRVWEGTRNVHEQIKELGGEIRGILTASEFNSKLFLEKTRRLQELHKMVREARDEAIVTLASQFTAEERSILADLISGKPGPPPGPRQDGESIGHRL